MGENISLSRALAISTQTSDIKLCDCTYPLRINSKPVTCGKYGAIVAIKCRKSDTILGTNLCQHIIGMGLQKIGDPLMDDPHKNADEERCMIYQEFLLDSSLRVLYLLAATDAEIVDFARFEIGEELDEEPTLKSTQTCG